MCELTTALTLASSAIGAYSQYQQGIAESNYNKAMAQQAQMQGEYAVRQAKQQSILNQDAASKELKNLKSRTREFSATQRAQMAAQGIDAGSVTGQDIATDTFEKSSLDEQSLRYNADVANWQINEDAKYNKWAADNQAAQYRAAAKNARRAGKLNAFSTLLGDSLPFASNKIKAIKSGRVLKKQTAAFGGGIKTYQSPDTTGLRLI